MSINMLSYTTCIQFDFSIAFRLANNCAEGLKNHNCNEKFSSWHAYVDSRYLVSVVNAYCPRQTKTTTNFQLTGLS